jgi:hypothetical protein
VLGEDIDHDLHDMLESCVRTNGAQGVGWLTAQARRVRRDARIDEAAILDTVASSTLLVERPDGTVDHLLRVLDGIVLTQRVRADCADRTDLWASVALQPLLNILAFTAVPVGGGGELRRSPFGHEAIVGPPGWLPAAAPHTLLGLRIEDGKVGVMLVDEADMPSLEQQQHVRELIACHYRRERWWAGQDDLESRPAELVRALAMARLEDPALLRSPYPPLDELLHDPLEQEVDRNHWRDFAACRQTETLSFYVTGMPQALQTELAARARLYGMSFDQFVIAVLGHLAWRTPFAEDMQPWDGWDPEQRSGASVSALEDHAG